MAMRVTQQSTPVAEATIQVLELFCPGQVARRFPRFDNNYIVLSYREDFSWLWQFYDETEAGLLYWIARTTEPTLIIVCDGLPSISESTINIADYVTPYDWAVACSCVVFNRWQSSIWSDKLAKPADLPRLRLLILDLNTSDQQVSFGLQQFKAFACSLPWIQVYRLIPSSPTNANDLSVDLLNEVLDSWSARLGDAEASEMVDFAASILRASL